MSEWRRVPIGAVAVVRSGFSFKSRDWQNEGVPVVKITNVRAGCVDLDGCSNVSESVAQAAAAYLLHRNDILITMSGEIGSIGIYRDDRKAVLNQRVGRFELLSGAEVDGRFLGFALQHPRVKAEFEAIAYGAAQPNISPTLIGEVEIDLPDLPQQRRIAAELRCLDDLIENNQRRIALLEQMAQAIYREWFVHFRYPGHEDDELVDSALGPVPAGWNVTRLGELMEFRYGKALRADDRNGGSVAVVGSSGVVGWHNECIVNGPAVIVGRKGNVGTVIWVSGDCWPIDTTYYVVTDVPLHYAYRLLGGTEFLDSHAAVPGLSRDQAYSLEVVVPHTRLTHEFDAVSGVLTSVGVLLGRQAKTLATLRDDLLPRLVTGAIDVSELDLDEPPDESAA